ncbi:MAG TPA: hypothetical protein VF131_00105, partial [Blastocatellia bacterium]|nr:hypothetical protein [Blastocatellia bacterium]
LDASWELMKGVKERVQDKRTPEISQLVPKRAEWRTGLAIDRVPEVARCGQLATYSEQQLLEGFDLAGRQWQS